MEIVEHLLVLVHLLGMAAIVGSAVFVARGTVTPALVWGARAQLVTGLILVGLAEMDDGDVNHAKIGVKFAIGLVLLVLVMANMRKPSIPRGLYFGLLALTVINICVAVFWSPVHA